MIKLKEKAAMPNYTIRVAAGYILADYHVLRPIAGLLGIVFIIYCPREQPISSFRFGAK